jgi:hypothetical protein
MKWKLFFALVFTFIAFTIIGTQTHEWGHYASAKYLGMNPSLHYQSVEFGEDRISNEGDEIFVQFEKQIIAKEDFPLKSRYQYLQKISSYNYFYSTLWGPLQTMITGTIGFIFIIIFRKRFFNTNALSTSQWLLVFLSLFWLREVFNTFMAGISFFVLGQKEFYGDEFNLCKHLNFPLFSIPIITAIIGIVICCIVTFKFVPKAERKTFIAAGFVGGTIGYIFWMYFLGPIILP